MRSTDESPVAAERVMVIAAHPDDAEIQCGGTVARLARAGAKVSYVLCTSGNRGSDDPAVSSQELALVREEEQRAAVRQLGVERVTFLGHDDGDLGFVQPLLRQKITRLLREERPDVVFTHDFLAGLSSYEVCYLHPDHRATGAAAFEASFFCAPGPLFYPEQLAEGLRPRRVAAMYLFMSDRPDSYVDISDSLETKIKAIACHVSQWGDHPDLTGFFTELAERLGRGRGLRFAEAFKVLRP
ncbi:MAG: PIG-L family deacetylase [Chloroflexi bacterium]|nr:PIG-L family deacetylase [Chloroflexota bacterium]